MHSTWGMLFVSVRYQVTVMKKILLAILLQSPCLLLLAQTNLEIKIDKIKNDNGNIMAGIHTKDNHFPKNASDGKIVKASKDGVIVVFENIKPGSYAISVIHDENENKDLDQNKIGIPKEGFGFSNNAMGKMGPPSFKEASFEIASDSKDTVITIELKYMGKKK